MSDKGATRWRVPAGKKVELDKIDPGSTKGAPGDKAKTEATLPHLHDELARYQDRLWAEAKRSLLVVVQGLDASGKDGTIRHVFQGVNPQGARVSSFKVPTPEEMAHDFLWRVHRQAPRAGEIGIFNRSHYEDVLVVRVEKRVPQKVWRARYDLINAFEDQLIHGGTTVVKLFLHVSKEEQRRRFLERLKRPDKRWKFDRSDLTARALWDDYQRAYEEALERTSRPGASWYVVPANRKWYRNWAASTILIETLKEIDPRYPDPPDLTHIEIS